MHVTRSALRTELAFAALLLGLLMAQLDTNIVVAALPAIEGDLGSGASGVFAVYLLTVTVSTPVHAALGDRWGRRPVFLAAVVLFAIGSLAAALAGSLPVLLGARAVQGLGGGGLVISAVSAIGEMFDTAERIRRQIWLTAIFGISSLAGPPVGGWLAAEPGWRWIFAVNLPLCIMAVALGIRTIPTKARRQVRSTGFDWAGAGLVGVGGTTIVVLGSSSTVANNPTVAAGLLVVTALMAAGLVRTERRSSTPLIPPGLFAIATMRRTTIATTLTGFAMFGSFAFIPLALAQGLSIGTGATGTLLVALTGGQLVVVTTFSILARRYPRMVPWGRLALVLGALGLGLLAAVSLTSNATPVAYIAAIAGLVSLGAGLGLSLQSYTLLGQSAAPATSFGAAMGLLTFGRQLGGSLGAAVFGWILLAKKETHAGPALVLASAALVVIAALFLAPRTGDEPARPPRDPRQDQPTNTQRSA